MREGYVSIIVPVYQSAEYLRRCVQSIMEQTYKKLQILLIDDGSTDESGSICDELALKDSRIEVYRIENRGVSDTRNFGLAKVRGEYVQFVDADDKLSKHMVRRLVSIISNQNTDMVVCNYIKQFERMYVPNMMMEIPGKYEATKYLLNTLKDPGHHYYGVVWNKLYRAEIIKNNNIKFDTDITLGEDFVFNIKYWQKCKTVYVDWRYMYIYSKIRDFTLSNIKHKKLYNCISELENRKKIFDVYYKAIKHIDNRFYTEEKIWRYWIVFFIRQKYSLRYEFWSWNVSDKKNWYDILHSDNNIRKALRIVPDNWVREYIKKYTFEIHIKNKVKETFHID